MHLVKPHTHDIASTGSSRRVGGVAPAVDGVLPSPVAIERERTYLVVAGVDVDIAGRTRSRSVIRQGETNRQTVSGFVHFPLNVTVDVNELYRLLMGGFGLQVSLIIRSGKESAVGLAVVRLGFVALVRAVVVAPLLRVRGERVHVRSFYYRLRLRRRLWVRTRIRCGGGTIARLGNDAGRSVAFLVNPCIYIPRIVIRVKRRTCMGSCVRRRAEEAVTVTCHIIARVDPPPFRIGTESEDIAVYRSLCTYGRRGPIGSELRDIDGFSVDIAGDMEQAVAVTGDILRAVAR